MSANLPEHFIFVGRTALQVGQAKEPQDLLRIAMDNTRMHKNWQGLYCFPVQVKGTARDAEPLFRIDEGLMMYVCTSCGEMWPYIVPPTEGD